MARRDVIEVTCDRCGRTEVQSKDEVSPAGKTEFEGKMPQAEVKFDDLCKRCRRAVANYFDKIRKIDDEEAAEENPRPKEKTRVSPLAS